MTNDQWSAVEGLREKLGGGFGREDRDGVASGVGVVELHDDLAAGGDVQGQAGVIGGDGELAAAAVDEDGELDLGGTAMVEQLIERGFHGAARKQDVVDEQNGGAGDIDGDARGDEFLGDGIALDVVAMKRDVEGSDRGSESRGETAGEFDASVGDTQKNQGRGLRVTFADRLGEPLNGGVDVGGRKAFGSGHSGWLCRSWMARTSGKSRGLGGMWKAPEAGRTASTLASREGGEAYARQGAGN